MNDMRHAGTTTRTTLMRIAAATLALTLTAAAAGADVVTLRRGASVSDPSVKLRDVATLDGAEAQKLALVEVASLGAGEQTIGLLDVKRRLDAAGVHWGRVTLRGATRITITHTPPDDADAGVEPAAGRKPGTHIAANLVQQIARRADDEAGAADAESVTHTGGADIDAPPARSVRQLIVQTILARLDADPADVRLTFADDSDRALDRTEASARFEIEPIGDNPVGRVPMNIRRYEGGRLVGADRVRVDVAVRRSVVVARRNLGRGQTITDSDIAAETRWVEAAADNAVTDASAVVGQRSVGMVREGNPITLDDIQPPIMVRRGQVVTVRCVSGSLVLKTVARALDDGAYGDLIQFRNERTREQFAARVTGMQQAVLSDRDPAPGHGDSALSAIDGGTTR